MLTNTLATIPPTSKSIQELLYDNLKDELSLTDPYTKYTEQEMIAAAEGAGLTIDQILGGAAPGGGGDAFGLLLAITQ